MYMNMFSVLEWSFLLAISTFSFTYTRGKPCTRLMIIPRIEIWERSREKVDSDAGDWQRDRGHVIDGANLH